MSTNETVFHKVARKGKGFLPHKASSFLRSFFTAIYTPVYFSYLNGHFKSSFKNKSVSAKGEILPWYTYPMIDFLGTRNFSTKKVMEFGGGQSTLWWAKRAKEVITFEDNKEWYEMLKKQIPSNVKLYLVSQETRDKCVSDIEKILSDLGNPSFDIAVIDGLFREEMIEIADKFVAHDGAVICDNAEGYGFYEGFRNRRFKKVDFFGHAPGVMLPHATVLYFGEDNFLLDPNQPIPTGDGSV